LRSRVEVAWLVELFSDSSLVSLTLLFVVRCVSLGRPKLAISLLMRLPIPRNETLLFSPCATLHLHPPWFIRDVLSSYISSLPQTPLSYRTPPTDTPDPTTPAFLENLDAFLTTLRWMAPSLFPGDPVVVALALRAFGRFLRGGMEASDSSRELAERRFQHIVGEISSPNFKWNMKETFTLGTHGKEDLETSLAGLPEEVRDMKIWRTIRTITPRRRLQTVLDLHRSPSAPLSSPSSNTSHSSLPPPPPLSMETLDPLLSALSFPIETDPILTLQAIELLSLAVPSEEGRTRALDLLRDTSLSSMDWKLAPPPAYSPSYSQPTFTSDSTSNPSSLSSSSLTEPTTSTTFPPPPSSSPSPSPNPEEAHQSLLDPGGPTYDELKSTLERLAPLLGEDVQLWNPYLVINSPSVRAETLLRMVKKRIFEAEKRLRDSARPPLPRMTSIGMLVHGK